ncbi:hypothetical protein [Peribacillus simplex]|uniref:hypothetical protein n=1 Tax=Peribacillus simplex TaxID=1478 RepID=UPI003CF334DC
MKRIEIERLIEELSGLYVNEYYDRSLSHFRNREYVNEKIARNKYLEFVLSKEDIESANQKARACVDNIRKHYLEC